MLLAMVNNYIEETKTRMQCKGNKSIQGYKSSMQVTLLLLNWYAISLTSMQKFRLVNISLARKV